MSDLEPVFVNHKKYYYYFSIDKSKVYFGVIYTDNEKLNWQRPDYWFPLRKASRWFQQKCRLISFLQNKPLDSSIAKAVFEALKGRSNCSKMFKAIKQTKISIPSYYTCYECPYYTIINEAKMKRR